MDRNSSILLEQYARPVLWDLLVFRSEGTVIPREDARYTKTKNRIATRIIKISNTIKKRPRNDNSFRGLLYLVLHLFWISSASLSRSKTMSLLQSTRESRGISLSGGRGPLVLRSTSTDDESSVEVSSPDTRLSEPGTLRKSIDWSLAYSSDEESQKNGNRSRSYSEPGLEQSTMRRRPRSLTFDPRTPPFSAPAATSEDSALRTRFTPMMCLAALFFICCYTTFWLPYPEVRPVGMKNIRPPILVAAPAQPAAKAVLRSVASAENRMIRGNTWMHARAEHAREPLIYRKEEDPLAKFYQQEAFTSYSFTKEINIGMLVVVSLWAAWEHRRRKAHVMEV